MSESLQGTLQNWKTKYDLYLYNLISGNFSKLLFFKFLYFHVSFRTDVSKIYVLNKSGGAELIYAHTAQLRKIDILGEENKNLYSKCHHPEETASDTVVSFLLVISFLWFQCPCLDKPHDMVSGMSPISVVSGEGGAWTMSAHGSVPAAPSSSRAVQPLWSAFLRSTGISCLTTDI